MKRTAPLLSALALVLAACNADSPVTENHLSHPGGVMLADLEKTADPQSLAALRGLTAPYHHLQNALDAHYSLFISPLTAPDGCVSDVHLGGMGYHYTRGNNLMDDAVTLLDPEFIVYAPRDNVGGPTRELAAFDYFIPYSPTWPGPDDPTFKRAPTLQDFPTMSGLGHFTFAPSRFSGWMFHIWLWLDNPGGEFTNWNRAIPLCAGSPF